MTLIKMFRHFFRTSIEYESYGEPRVRITANRTGKVVYSPLLGHSDRGYAQNNEPVASNAKSIMDNSLHEGSPLTAHDVLRVSTNFYW